ncbi:pentatricopeptide repeat-containing protein 2, mitochondrial-like isoform X1 [Mytilus trossulus]|uniref:pentatricopeptide repeat-containing protein 2, mitochondrial-like isoform X1 n=1 Tax=Mytilus trossulus TaxID=6551 RepID=UPI003006894D
MKYLVKQLLWKNINQGTRLACKPTCRRWLMADVTLGLDRFRKNVDKTCSSFKKENVRKDILFKNSKTIPEDEVDSHLLNMIYIATTDEEVKVCAEIANRTPYNRPRIPNKPTMTDQFNYGPLLMRMLHNLRKPHIAVSFMEDKDLKEMLHHPTTCLIYMDLLYEAGLYEKVVEFYENTFKEIFERAKRKQKSAGLLLYDMNHTTITVAALYKLNSQESLQKVVNLLKGKLHDDEGFLSNRTRAFAAALALNQNETELALDFIDMSETNPSVFNKSLKIIILSKLDRAHQALDLLVRMTSVGTVAQQLYIFPDCLEALKEAINKSEDMELAQTYEEKVEHLQTNGKLQKQSLFEALNENLMNSKRGAIRYRFTHVSGNKDMSESRKIDVKSFTQESEISLKYRQMDNGYRYQPKLKQKHSKTYDNLLKVLKSDKK